MRKKTDRKSLSQTLIDAAIDLGFSKEAIEKMMALRKPAVKLHAHKKMKGAGQATEPE